MEQTERKSLNHYRVDPLPEKPLESEPGSNGNGSNSGPRQKKSQKPSKFKSIFTRRSLSTEVVPPAVLPTQVREGAGKGDNGSKVSSQSQLPTSISKKSIIRDPSNEKLSTDARSNPRPSTSTNNLRQEHIQVDVHQVDDQVEEHQTPTNRPATVPEFRSRSKEQKKGVTIYEPPTPAVLRNQSLHLLQSGRKRSKRNCGGGSSTSCTRRGNQSQLEKPGKMDARTLKKKYKHLLSLVEELTEHCEFYKTALRHKETNQDAEKIKHRKETEALNMQMYKLGQEMDSWKEECLKMENKNTMLVKVKNLGQENHDLHADIEVHKSVIIRLNKELAYYQDKLRFKYRDTPEQIPVYSSGTDTDEGGGGDSTFPEENGDWLLHPRKSLLPLLIAYDEVIAEKDELLKDHEITIDRFKGRCMEIVKENEALHQLISSSKERGSISIEEWEFLRSNAEIVLEENDLLHGQVENLKQKEEKLLSLFQVKAAEFKQMITQHEAEISRQQSKISDLEAKCKQLGEEHSNMAASLHSRIPREKHEEMVHEFKRAFEELKGKYEADKKVIGDKLDTAEKERESMMEEVANLENENTHLRNDLHDSENGLSATTEALEQLKASLLATTSARESANVVIEDFVKHVQQITTEKNQVVEELNQQKILNSQMMTLRAKENDLVKQLHDKIEAMDRLHNDEVKSVQSKVKELEEALRTKGERHRRENLQLTELLDEKDRRMEAIEESKRQLQQDLETVWRTTTTTMNASLKNRNV